MYTDTLLPDNAFFVTDRDAVHLFMLRFSLFFPAGVRGFPAYSTLRSRLTLYHTKYLRLLKECGNERDRRLELVQFLRRWYVGGSLFFLSYY